MERLKAFVIVVSDRASKGIYEDKTGPIIEKWLFEKINFKELIKFVVPDEKKELEKIFKKCLKEKPDLIITTGGTGFSPRDITPEVTEKFIQKKAPGISEYLRIKGLNETPLSCLSRGIAGLHKKTLIINLPGSIKAVENNLKSLENILEHCLDAIKGMEKHNL